MCVHTLTTCGYDHTRMPPIHALLGLAHTTPPQHDAFPSIYTNSLQSTTSPRANQALTQVRISTYPLFPTPLQTPHHQTLSPSTGSSRPQPTPPVNLLFMGFRSAMRIHPSVSLPVRRECALSSSSSSSSLSSILPFPAPHRYVHERVI